MPHVNRSRRKANAARRLMRSIRQHPVTPARQRELAEARAAEHLRRYPHPPVYRYRDSDPKPVQPLCYEFVRE